MKRGDRALARELNGTASVLIGVVPSVDTERWSRLDGQPSERISETFLEPRIDRIIDRRRPVSLTHVTPVLNWEVDNVPDIGNMLVDAHLQ